MRQLLVPLSSTPLSKKASIKASIARFVLLCPPMPQVADFSPLFNFIFSASDIKDVATAESG